MKQAALTIVVPIEGSELSSLRTQPASIEDPVRERSPGASGIPRHLARNRSSKGWSDFLELPLGQEPRT